MNASRSSGRSALDGRAVISSTPDAAAVLLAGRTSLTAVASAPMIEAVSVSVVVAGGGGS
jgi:hypothetical protein